MTFKITARFNRIIKIAALILFALFIINSIVAVGNINMPRPLNLTFFIAKSTFDMLMLYYLISALIYAGEKKHIAVAFMIFFGTEMIRRLDIIVEKHMLQNVSDFSGVMILVTLLFTIYLFVTCFFIRNRVVFSPVLLFVSALFAIFILKMAASLILPYIAPGQFGSVQGDHNTRKVMDFIDVLAILMPVAILLLANRIDKFIQNQQAAISI